METTATISVCEGENGAAVSPPLMNAETTATDTIKFIPYEITRNERLRRDYVFRIY